MEPDLAAKLIGARRQGKWASRFGNIGIFIRGVQNRHTV